MKRAVVFVNETDADYVSIFQNQTGGERVRAQMEMRNCVSPGKQRSADFSSRGIAVGMENTGAAVCCFTRKGEFRSGTIEFRAPFDELRDVLRAFFDKQGDSLGTAQSIPGVERVLLVKPDLVFVGKGHGDSALRPGGRGVAQIGFRQNQNASGRAQLNRRPQSGDSAAHNSVISTMAFLGVRHKSGEQAAPVW